MSFEQPPFLSTMVNSASKVMPAWVQWFGRVQAILGALTASGPTEGRPTTGLYVGQSYFDTTVGKPVFWDGESWVTW